MNPTPAQQTGFYREPVWKDYLQGQRSSLPALPDVDESISPRVVRFLGCNPGDMQLQGTNTYLVGDGNTRLLVDTGEGKPEWARNITRYLEDHEITISHVLLTHCHKDHTGGIDDLLAYDDRITICKYMPELGQESIEHGQIFGVQGATLIARHTPGHSPDSICLELVEEQALFTGDSVLGHGFSVVEDLSAYTQSLDTMRNSRCLIGYPGHGDVIRDLPRVMTRYIEQRALRERQILNTLRSATMLGLSAIEIASLMYGGSTKENVVLSSAAKPLINQVLVSLQQKGRVYCRHERTTDDRWFVQPSVKA